MHGSGKFGLAGLSNLDQLPPTGAIVIAAPLKIVGGSGSPCGSLRSRPESLPSPAELPSLVSRVCVNLKDCLAGALVHSLVTAGTRKSKR